MTFLDSGLRRNDEGLGKAQEQRGVDMATIFHLIQKEEWEAAKTSGEVKPESLAEEGFIHCSSDEQQALAVATRLYSEQEGMLLLEVDTELLGAPVKREPSSSGQIYPHIYGPLNTSAVTLVRALEADSTGGFRLPGG